MAAPAVPGKPAKKAQALLRWLVNQAAQGAPHVCTYEWAYTEVMGRRPQHWSQVHAKQLLSVAVGTRPVPLEGLGLVRLDTFIVRKSNGQPGAGHWTRAPYSVERWRDVLAGANTLSYGGPATARPTARNRQSSRTRRSK